VLHWGGGFLTSCTCVVSVSRTEQRTTTKWHSLSGKQPMLALTFLDMARFGVTTAAIVSVVSDLGAWVALDPGAQGSSPSGTSMGGSDA
jgi:hypothetical protein